MLETCVECHGFIPPQLSECPHCERTGKISRSAYGGIAFVAVASVTLMACYGAPFDDTCDSYPALGETAVRVSSGAVVTDQDISCGNGTKLRAFSVEAPEPGTTKVLWTGPVPFAVGLKTCNGLSEYQCVEPRAQGELSFTGEGAHSLFIAGLSDEQAAEAALRVEFVPDCGNGVRDQHEECDDGNREGGDGCDPFCLSESAASGDSGAPGLE